MGRSTGLRSGAHMSLPPTNPNAPCGGSRGAGAAPCSRARSRTASPGCRALALWVLGVGGWWVLGRVCGAYDKQVSDSNAPAVADTSSFESQNLRLSVAPTRRGSDASPCARRTASAPIAPAPVPAPAPSPLSRRREASTIAPPSIRLIPPPLMKACCTAAVMSSMSSPSPYSCCGVGGCCCHRTCCCCCCGVRRCCCCWWGGRGRRPTP